jgi:hypothetical protein
MAGQFTRDPISVEMDPIAARLLRRAYSSRGEWAGTYLKNPSAEWQVWALRNGHGRLLGPDPVPGGKARTRWARALIRACYDMNRKYMTRDGLDLGQDPRPLGIHPPYPLRFEVGTVRLAPGGIVVGRAVRIKLDKRGTKDYTAAVDKAVDSEKRWRDDGPMNAHGGWGL